jgi:hypothetical protein
MQSARDCHQRQAILGMQWMPQWLQKEWSKMTTVYLCANCKSKIDPSRPHNCPEEKVIMSRLALYGLRLDVIESIVHWLIFTAPKGKTNIELSFALREWAKRGDAK